MTNNAHLKTNTLSNEELLIHIQFMYPDLPDPLKDLLVRFESIIEDSESLNVSVED